MGAPQTILSPFRAIRYDLGGTSNLSDLLAPPFDVVSGAMHADLLARHPYNFIRVDLPDDGEGRHQRAADTLEAWLSEGVLRRDEEHALYLLEQEFRAGDRRLRRRGVFGLVRLPEAHESYVLPHEGTLPAPKADRLRLMRTCRAMTSPVFLIAEDQDGDLSGLMRAVDGPPEATAEGPDEVLHRVWTLRETKLIDALCAAVGTGPLVIADGHHRFQTAMDYRDEMREAHPEAHPEAGFRYALVLLGSAHDEGLTILPTHRLVSCPEESARKKAAALMREYFEVHESAPAGPGTGDRRPWLESAPSGRHVYGAYCGDDKYYVLVARDDMLSEHQSVVDRLDVSVLHRYLIEPILSGLSSAPDDDGRISHDSYSTGLGCPGARLTYVTDEQRAIAAVRHGDYHFAFFVRPTRIADVIVAARAGQRMPGKSTYFYPKVPSGIVFSDASSDPI